MAEEKDYDNLQERLSTLGGLNPPANAPAQAASRAETEKKSEKTVEASNKPVVSTEKGTGDDGEKPTGPVGLQYRQSSTRCSVPR